MAKLELQGTHDVALGGIWDGYYPVMRTRMPFYNLLNKEYSQDVKQKGIISVPAIKFKDPLIREYKIFDGIPLQQSESELISISAGKLYAINELIDNCEASMVPFDLKQRMLVKAMDEMAHFIENSAIKEFTAGGGSEGTASTLPKPTETTVYDNLLQEVILLAKQGVATSDIRIVISGDTERMLLLDPRYTNSGSEMGSGIVRTGEPTRGINGAIATTSYSLDINYVIFNSKASLAVEYCSLPLKIVDIQNERHIGASRMIAKFNHGYGLLNKEMFLYNDK